jgi:hypothetical protein
VQKHGLVANGRAKYAPRGGLEKDALEALCSEGLTVAQIAQRLGRSTSTIRHWLRKFGLKTVGSRRHRDAALQALEAGRTRFISTCHRHGRGEFLVFSGGRSRCARCNGEAVARRRRKVKQILVEEAGGRCELCGYDRYVGALHFHHVDPGRKSFALSHEGITRSLVKSRRKRASACCSAPTATRKLKPASVLFRPPVSLRFDRPLPALAGEWSLIRGGRCWLPALGC